MAKPSNVAASVHQRLLNKSRDSNRPFMELLQYYAMERFLYRMSRSEFTETFILKGALLLKAVGVDSIRPTRDIDFLGISVEDISDLEDMIRACCRISFEDDGLEFDPDSVSGVEIREDQAYQGVRITFKGSLGKAEISMQIDIGFGDVVSPTPLWVDYPVLLDSKQPKLLAYTLESAMAEKYQAMVALDLINSRMKDFYDIWYLLSHHTFEGAQLAEAIRITFERRKTPLPSEVPTAFTETFYNNPQKIRQWKAYRKKIRDEKSPESLEEVVGELKEFLYPITEKLGKGNAFNNQHWKPDAGWTHSKH